MLGKQQMAGITGQDEKQECRLEEWPEYATGLIGPVIPVSNHLNIDLMLPQVRCTEVGL